MGLKKFCAENNVDERIYKKIDNTYYHIKNRCYNSKYEHYDCYGGRGIKVCSEWLNNKLEFINWCLSNGVKNELTIDRINNNGNYEPSNCRWVSLKEQNNNRRDNIKINYKDKIYSLYEICDLTGLKYHTLRARLKVYGYSVEDAINAQLGKINLRRCKGGVGR